MRKINFLPATLVAIALITSCKNLGELSADYFTVTPTPLEAIAGQVPATIDGTFPEKYLKKKAVVTVTPVLKYDGGQIEGVSATFQGEKVAGNNQTISYKTGGTYTMKALFDYAPELLKSDLYAQFDAKIGKKTVTIPEVKISYGIIATSQLLTYTLDSATPSYAVDAYQRIIQQKQEANIKFLIQQARVRDSELSNDDITSFVNMLKEINDQKETRALQNIEISAYASPDGKVDFNTQLAEQRQNNSEKYIRKQLNDNNILATVDTKYTAEDWDGFQQLVAASNIQDKDVILRVLSMYSDPEEREAEIKNLSQIFQELAEQILPELRRARLTLNYEIIGRSDQQIIDQFSSDPSQLSVEELLYGATLVDDQTKETWYEKTIQQYPEDYRAYNNLAVIYYKNGDLGDAEENLVQAKKINSNASEVNANLALIALNKGNISDAETYLGQASGAEGFNEANAALNIAKGNYTTAAAAAAGINSNTAALAQLLNKDYVSAKSTLQNTTNKDAYTYYLLAVVAARTSDTSGVSSNLNTAVTNKPSLKQRAQKDLEFQNYQTIINSL